ncbi:MAG: extracellular solute-binding protein [candidate division NC10 bacterium]|nr:extracellular solute-binding protein [candidate division NC10 bacterium]
MSHYHWLDRVDRREFLRTVAGATALGVAGDWQATALPARAAARKNFGGKTVRVAASAEYYAVAFRMFREKAEQEYGIKIAPEVIPSHEAYQRVMLEFSSRASSYDIVMFSPQWLADFARHLEPLKPMADAAGLNLSLEDVLPAFRDMYSTWAGRLYAMPFDGDMHILYYNTAAFGSAEYQQRFRDKYGYPLAPPQTWEQYRDMAEFSNGWDWFGDGQKHYGASDGYRPGRTGFWWFMGRFANYGGVYFDEEMRPLINSPNGVKALQNMVEIFQFAPPGSTNFGYTEVETALVKGDVALSTNWTSVARVAEDPNRSKVVGKIGYAMLPGTMIGGKLHRVGSLASGWSLGIPKYSANKEAALHALELYTRPDVSVKISLNPATGVDYTRRSSVESSEARAAWPSAPKFLEVIKASVDVGFPAPLIPGAEEYMKLCGDAMAAAVAKTKGVKQALDDAAREWDRITDRLGRDTQKQLWKAQYDAMKKRGLVYKSLA